MRGVGISLTVRSALVAGILLLATLAGRPGGAAPPPQPASPRDLNLVLIFVDTLRADHLGCYGYPRPSSPAIDTLAADGITFEGMYTPHTVTLPSFMSIITGLYPESHGVQLILKDRLSPRVGTLGESLKAGGFATFWFGPGDDPHLDPAVGFGRGFDRVEVFPDNLARARESLLGALDQAGGRRFFLAFHTYKMHVPYFPAPRYREMFPGKRVPAVPESLEELEEKALAELRLAIGARKGLAWDLLGEELVDRIARDVALEGHPGDLVGDILGLLKPLGQRYRWHSLMYRLYAAGVGPRDAEGVAQLVDLYDACILEFDQEIVSPLVKGLRARGLYEKTVIALVADHGEEFGEHGGFRHGTTLYEEATHVPFILRVPGGKKGVRNGSLLQTVDIAPTLLELLGAPPLPLAQGVSIAGDLEGKGKGSGRERVFGSIPFLSYVQDREWKLIVPRDCINFRSLPPWMCRTFPFLFEEERRLFRHADDPGERVNLADGEVETVDRLEAELVCWQKMLPGYAGTGWAFPPTVDERTRERIRRTGYW